MFVLGRDGLVTHPSHNITRGVLLLSNPSNSSTYRYRKNKHNILVWLCLLVFLHHQVLLDHWKRQQSTTMFKSMRESRFIFDSFAEGDSEMEDLHPPEEEHADETGVKKVAKKDSRKVKLWRYLVLFMLLVAGGSTSALTYILLNGEEEDDFETSVSILRVHLCCGQTTARHFSLIFDFPVPNLCQYHQRRIQNSYQQHQQGLWGSRRDNYRGSNYLGFNIPIRIRAHVWGARRACTANLRYRSIVVCSTRHRG